jgi:methionyl-tRNA formyltransferase
VVVAYGKIVPEWVLEAPKNACVNIHGSILPAYRWASPIQEAVKNWDPKTGLTIMYMSKGMDEWDILKIEEVDIDRDDTSLDIFNKFQDIWSEVLIKTLEWVLSWEVVWKKQDDSKATYCSKIEKEDWNIDFTDTARNIYNKHKAYKTWPGIFSKYKDKKFSIEECNFIDCEILEEWVFDIWDILEYSHDWKDSIWVACGSGILLLKKIKLEWKKSMDINSFINGNKDFLDYNFK